MKAKLVIVVAILSLGVPVFAHRLDEYLQAMIVAIEQGQIHASMRLVPGVAVSSAVIAAIDSDGDGIFSHAEQQTYAREVLGDLTLSVDGHALKPWLRAVSFPAPADMKEGLGEIHIESYFRLDYVQASPERDSFLLRWRSRFITALASFAGVPSMFRLGMRHIAEGTDHLLFLIALLLPAPLLAVRSRWAAAGSIHHSLVQIVRVVTAFTIGHSATLGLGAWGLVSLPSRVVEVLIAFSILVSSIHALRPLFPGREPAIAAGFGLVHGLAVATTLQNLGVGPWQRIASILGFNLGIETMQLIVVGAILPSLIALSRTPAYRVFRFCGALFAGFASLGWIIERLFGVPDFVDGLVDRIAQGGVWIAISLIVTSILLWLRHDTHSNHGTVTEQLSHPTLEGI
ncbi:MAG TPA: HupE/UreJ family protein [Bryobacteraceae bacterium]|jgi:hypothetical protein|nr:HupE/UreJ family protein [Bryobacteraceae bacterium]